MTEAGKESLKLHEDYKGKIATQVKVPLKDQHDLSLAYTPGVADVAMICAVNTENVYKYTVKQNLVAVVSDGSSVLGLGNIGPLGALPVMEGKAALLKHFAGIDAVPICLSTQEPDDIIATVKNIAPSFGAILLEDIAAPKCFMIEEMLQDVGIPVMHDDQHGTAVVVRAALLNAAKVVGKQFSDLKVVISGGGAAGQATAKILLGADNPKTATHNIIIVDSKGIIVEGRSDLDPYKEFLATHTNREHCSGDLAEALVGADAFVGLSRGNIATVEMIQKMAANPIVFALSNPEPEIHPEKAKLAGAPVIATGQSDMPNQVNNLLAFPGIFLGALRVHASQITVPMLLAASNTLAAAAPNPSAQNIIPSVFTPNLAEIVAQAVAKAT